ncbi:MAG: transcriptional regulator [Bacteroidetes bacterium]|nr:MAG: transcriptional regulator [Bacteroidota bacterium]
MKDHQEMGGKLYYKIGEVSKMVGEPASTLRYWENEFPQLKPMRTSKDRRKYTQEDVELIKRIHYYLRVEGMSPESVKKRLSANSDPEVRRVEAIQSITEAKELLLELKKLLG